MKRLIPGWELRERWIQWNVSLYDIVDIIVNGELTAYNLLDHTPVDIDIEKQCKDHIRSFAEEHGEIALMGISLNSVMENQKKDLTHFITLNLDGFLFKVAEVVAYEATHNVMTVNIFKDKPITDTESKMQKARVKGGKAEKVNVPIIEASKEFILKNHKRGGQSDMTIAKSFQNKYKSDHPIEIMVGLKKYAVYGDGTKIICICLNDSRDKYHDKSIEYSTFIGRYISKAKKAIKAINGVLPNENK